MMSKLSIILALVLAWVPGLMAQEVEAISEPGRSVVKVAVTGQGYDFYRPWQRSGRATRIGLGSMLDATHFLVTATLVEDAVLVELERFDSGDQAPARVVCVDYTANLAIVECTDPNFLEGMTPLELAGPAKVGDAATAWQFEDNGTPFLSTGIIRAIHTAPYPYAGQGLLVYRAEIPLSQLTSSFVIPVITDGKLSGLLMHYDTNTRIMTLVSSPVIKHFVDDWRNGPYDGFPTLGVNFALLDDPQFRRYLEMEGLSGVYISDILPLSAAAEAGLQEGDVLIAIDEHIVDRNGEYRDPDFDRTSLGHLISTRSFAGDTRELRVVRDGDTLVIPVKLSVLRTFDQPVPTFVKDQAPLFMIQAGLVFTELTGEYLAAWGNNWRLRAPRRLVFYQTHQYRLLEPGQRLVFVSYVLPFNGNVGYDDISHQVVTQINGREIYSLRDAAAAFEQPIRGFHEIVFEVNARKVYLKASELAASNETVRQLYRLPALQRLGTKP